jgi:phosphoesterase RecJ-like protein
MVAAKLIELGADAAEINRQLFDLKSIAQIRAEGEAARRLRVFDEGHIAVTTIPYFSKVELELSDDDLGTIIEIPRAVSTADVAISIRQPEEKGFFRVSMRSNSDIDVAKICAVFGGGGHIRAAGCSLEAENIDEALDKVLITVRKELNI